MKKNDRTLLDDIKLINRGMNLRHFFRDSLNCYSYILR